MICLRCKKEFIARNTGARSKQLYCSKICKTRAHSARRSKHRIQHGRKYCSTAAYRNIILSMFDTQCTQCDSTKNLHIHHIIPRYLGGQDIISNITILCGTCHIKLHKEYDKKELV